MILIRYENILSFHIITSLVVCHSGLDPESRHINRNKIRPRILAYIFQKLKNKYSHHLVHICLTINFHDLSKKIILFFKIFNFSKV
jgi:hypothetical protein